MLGQPLVARLVELGYAVTALGKRRRATPPGSGAEYRYGDLAERVSAALLRPWRWDAVVHLAGPVPKHHTALPDDYATLSEHVNAALNVCLAVPAHWPGRLVLISGMNVYGNPEYLPVDEGHPRRPVNVYGAAKALAEDVATAVAAERCIDLWVLRVCGLFTEARRSGAVYQFLSAALRGDPVVISALVPTPWDIIHLSDAVEAIARALCSESGTPGPINIGYGEAVDLVSVAQRIVAMTNHRSPIVNETGVHHPKFQMDVEKARRVLGWHPATLDARLESMRRSLTGEDASVGTRLG